ncbi:SDR family NAD(P)-dependent oxidoreductase [Pyxidicoccus sp. 3LG]
METKGQERTALITGASSGIGLELARRMLSEGWQVVALNRSGFPEDDPLIRDSLGTGKLRVYRADLSDFDSLRAALGQIKAREEKLDLLFNNAGGSFPELLFSKQGRELHYEVQTVVPFILFMELKELLRRGSLKTVINTSTNAFDFVRRFDADTLERPPTFKKLLGPYATTKLALSLWTRELGPRVAAEGFKLHSVDPGSNNTLRDGKNPGLPFFALLIMKWVAPPPNRGASRLHDAAVDGNGNAPGAYIRNGVAKELRFVEQGQKVLEKVSAIYEREFRSPKPNLV